MSAIIKHMQTRIISEFEHILFNFLFMHLASALNQQHDSKEISRERHKNPPTGRALLRILAWLTRLSEVSLNAQHIPGIFNKEADMLSREPEKFDMCPAEQFGHFHAGDRAITCHPAPCVCGILSRILGSTKSLYHATPGKKN